MPQTLAVRELSDEGFAAFLASRDEPAWLLEQRKRAWAVFQSLGLPEKTLEQWRRTDLRTFRFERFGLPVGEAPSPAAAGSQTGLLTAGVELGGQLASIDSLPVSGVPLHEDLARQGVLFGSLGSIARQHPELVERVFQKNQLDPATDKFAALNAAAFSGGMLLYVPEGVIIEQPLHALSQLTPGGVDLSRTIIVLEAGAEATVMAETAGPEGKDPGLHCGSITLHLGRNSRLRYVTLQNWGPGVWHFAHHRAFVDAGAQLQWTVGALGGKLAKVNQEVVLEGQGAFAQVNGVMFTQGRQHLAYHTLQHHRAENCTSDLLYKGALQDRSHLVWRGMIQVDPAAQKTNGYQRNDNLMLSDQARTDSIPGLEIQADDVICTHGATTGRVDDETVFYAQTRGIGRQEATRMIVAGFFQQVFDRITIDNVREALTEAIGQRVQALGIQRD